ncbi:EF-hand calcium-binding domain-containing protein 4A isoform X2 [Xenopus laevis]|nr:EF-hand calcium-binding domain-containing protein 4A isoform X2 [Xenopus laevis]
MEHLGSQRRMSPSARARIRQRKGQRTPPSPLIAEPDEMMGKAHELFQFCDKEDKGLITKRDLQRLQNDLPLTPEQLEAVFDSLDQSNNGYLTPVEFSMGLGKLLGVNISHEEENESSMMEETFESGWSDGADEEDDAEEMLFSATMEHLGASQIFHQHKEIRDLWSRLRNERPELLSHFEEFLYRVSSYIQDVHHEKDTLEQALKRKETDHGREVRCLYEEMEQQIKIERERLLKKDSSREHDRHRALRRDLVRKEQELEGLVLRQKQLEHQLRSLNSEQLQTRVQNDQLRQLNGDLMEQLEKTKSELERSHGNLERLRRQEQEVEEGKKRDVFKVSRNMQKEKQSLLRQLELLRDINKKLRDEKDMFEAMKLNPSKQSLSDPVPLPGCCCCCSYYSLLLSCHSCH